MTQANAHALVDAFKAADAGDPTLLVNLYADDMTWAGFTLDGSIQLYTKGEFLDAFGVLAQLDESKNEVVSTEVVADSLVRANVRIYRRKGEHELDTTMVMTHRFEDGKVTRGTDMCPPQFEQFWAAAGITG